MGKKKKAPVEEKKEPKKKIAIRRRKPSGQLWARSMEGAWFVLLLQTPVPQG